MTDNRNNVIMIEGPFWADCGYYGRWLSAVSDLENEMRELRLSNAEFDDYVSLHMERDCFLFLETTAMAIVRDLVNDRCTAVINLYSHEGEVFWLLVGGGLFVKTGKRYQLVVPRMVDFRGLRRALNRYVATTDADSVMHPEELLVHMLPAEAEDLRFRLLKMDQRIRLADRDALLDEAASGIGYWNILAA